MFAFVEKFPTVPGVVEVRIKEEFNPWAIEVFESVPATVTVPAE